MNKNELRSLQEQAVLMLASGVSITETSKVLSIDRGTLYNWFKDTEFVIEYRKQRAEIKESARNRLLNLYNMALDTINEILQGSNDGLKLKTAMFVIQFALEFETNKTVKDQYDSVVW